jgi:cell division transport system permease protein
MTRWLRQHVRMFSRACAKLFSAPLGTLFNVVVVGIALALPASLYVLLVNVQDAVRTISPDPQLTLFLDLGATRTDVQTIDGRLKAHPQVAALRYLPRDRALEELKRTTGNSGIAEGLGGNPLPDAFVIDARDAAPAALQRLKADLAAWPKVAHVQLDAEWAQRLDALMRLGRTALLLLGSVLAFALVAITFNTIRLQILTQRDEVEVSTLIGATRAFVRRPFLHYGALLGLLGGLAAWGFVWLTCDVLNRALLDVSYFYGSRWVLRPLSPADGASLLAFSTALGWLGAWLSVGRHLADAQPR